MALLNVEVWDATGTKRQVVQMPDDAPVNRILAVLLEKMNFPQYAPDGQPLSYKFHHRASGKQLIDEQTLGEVGVKNGDVLRLQPEITAGARMNPGMSDLVPSPLYAGEREEMRSHDSRSRFAVGDASAEPSS